MASLSFHNPVLMTPLLTLLRKARSLSQILQIHAQSIAIAIFSHPFFASRLLFSLSRLSKPPSSKAVTSYADLIFLQFQNPTSFLWNTIIKIQAQNSNPHRSVLLFVQMRRNGVEIDEYTYPFLLNACSSSSGLELGAAIHGELLKRGCEADLYARNCLITFYSRCGEVVSSRKVFDGIGAKDLVSWNSMIAGYARSGHMVDAQHLFDEMPERDVFSWAILVDGYGKRAGDVERAQQVFDEMPERDSVVWNTMIDSYARVGNLAKACELFSMMPMKNLISWTSLIDGHLRHGDPNEALDLFQRSLHQGLRPDGISIVGAITACAQLGALSQGKWVHSYMVKKEIPLDLVVTTALIDMYMKCGSIEIAQTLFANMHNKTIVSWNAMIVGLGMNGYHFEAVELFDRMRMEGASVDDLIFLSVLTACTHGGLIDDAMRIFLSMKNDSKIEPKAEHYGCLVDLFGRAGRLHEALGIIEAMTVDPTPALWGSLLAASRTHRCIELAEIAMRQLVGLKGDDGGMYVLMSNMYAEKGMWDDVGRMRRLMSGRGMSKEIGRSVVEVDGSIHEFVNGDGSDAVKERIYEVVWGLTLGLDSIGPMDCDLALIPYGA